MAHQVHVGVSQIIFFAVCTELLKQLLVQGRQILKQTQLVR